MFSTWAFRAAQPLRQQARTFASAGGSRGGVPWGKILLYGGGATTAATVGGWAWLTATGELLGASRLPEDKRPYVPGRHGEAPEFLHRSGTSTEGMTPFLTGGDQGWVSVKLESVEEVSHNVKKLRFSLPEAEMVSGMFTTSCILTRMQKPGEKPVIRPYTPVSAINAQGFVELLIKKYDDGPMSSYVHSLKTGDTLDIKGPIPKYWWSSNKHKNVAMIAGGTGITPMWQLIHDIFADPRSRVKVTLVFGNIKEEDILLRKQLQDLENLFPRHFRVFYLLDQPPEGWAGEKGYVTKELLKQVLPEPKEDNIKIFVCGPPGMMKAVSGPKKSPKDQGEVAGILKELGYSEEQVYKF